MICAVLVFCTFTLDAQSGGRKREGKSRAKKTWNWKKQKSMGHADEFAHSSGRRSRWSRLFRKEKPAWVYKSSGSRRSQHKANRYLFKRHQTEGRELDQQSLDKQNKKRARRRDRGNESFKRKKY
ncbi:MAG TPA: hypothetical protein PLQ93_01280 [Bacteroidia bacterium]|nr:hypothetical protein [Bacteroidia bacterium]